MGSIPGQNFLIRFLHIVISCSIKDKNLFVREPFLAVHSEKMDSVRWYCTIHQYLRQMLTVHLPLHSICMHAIQRQESLRSDLWNLDK
jgi:hypothetical protein